MYWFVFAVIATLSVSEFALELRPYRQGLRVFIVAVLMLLVGFRYASVDYFSYLDIWDRLDFKYFAFPFYSATGGTTGNEFLFASMLSTYKALLLPFEAFIFSVALISLGIKFYFFRRYSPYFIVCIVLYLSMGFLLDLGQIRNGLAGAILLFTIEPVFKRQLFRFLLVLLVASGVQVFALMGLPLYWLFPILRNKIFATIGLITAFIISISGGLISRVIDALGILPPQLSVKVLGYFFGESNHLLYYNALNVSFFFFAILFVWFSPALTRKLDVAPVLISFHTYSVIVYFLSFDFVIVASRIFELLSFNAVIILLPLLSLSFSRKFRGLFIAGLISYAGLLFFAVVSSSDSVSYQNILFR